MSRNACIETIPCDCHYQFEQTDFRATLELTSIAAPNRAFRVNLGELQAAAVRIEASSAGDAADFTVAIVGRDDRREFVEYLLLQGL